MEKQSKKESKIQIEEFFSEIKSKTPKEIRKIKRMASSSNIRLKEKRKLFCKKCLMPYSGNEKTRVKKGVKSVECKDCGYVARWTI